MPESSSFTGRQTLLCLNYVQRYACLIDASPCLLGSRGSEARNQDRKCPKQGRFDVWRTREDSILISDLGGPYEGVKDCYGLGISLREASRVAQDHASLLAAEIVTTQRKCGKCGVVFWPRAGLIGDSRLHRGASHFCASCMKLASEAGFEEYRRQVCLDEWCG
jgi:hypothetical protein